MDGVCGSPHQHSGLVIALYDGRIEVMEYTSQSFSSWSDKSKLPVWILVFLDPFGVCAKAKKTVYTYKQLKERNAKKKVFPEEVQKYKCDSNQIRQNVKERLQEPARLYSLLYNNCDHLVTRCLFGVSVSYQLDDYKNYLYIPDIIYTVCVVIQLAIVGFVYVTGSQSSSFLVCTLLQLVLACYQSYKCFNMKKYIATSCFNQQMACTWTKAILSIVFAWLIAWFYPSSLTLCCVTVGLVHCAIVALSRW